MSKPLNENLRNIHVGDDNGDSRPLLEAAGDLLCELVRLVSAHGKPGALTLKLEVRPSTAGAMAIKPTLTLKKPQGLPAEALLWPTPDGNLETEDPRQTRLELRATGAPVREIKAVV